MHLQLTTYDCVYLKLQFQRRKKMVSNTRKVKHAVTQRIEIRVRVTRVDECGDLSIFIFDFAVIFVVLLFRTVLRNGQCVLSTVKSILKCRSVIPWKGKRENVYVQHTMATGRRTMFEICKTFQPK